MENIKTNICVMFNKDFLSRQNVVSDPNTAASVRSARTKHSKITALRCSLK